MAVKFEKLSESKYFLDVRGYVCPHPQMYTKKAMEKIPRDACLEVVLDNPSSCESIFDLCKIEGYKIVDYKEEGGVFRFQLCKE
ncbi:MAG: sulfurtransferase TusA family protein [Hydrogenobacter thermophilus]|uniref:sulfurtransferase TusA family protein n=1 Tax=Hydrogenobacter thermophilus TaxID=940 RepID=UPI001C79002A|nr:sulfurtransferase TusA family protein [Hydrogenobacter thermophilus]QWK19328.1 MAG: sulfurtransferase TusA family protein [Hydrogenobacter thermophilus]